MGDLMTQTTSYEALEKKYGDFEAPNAIIKIEDKLLPNEVMDSLNEVNVSLTCNYAEMNVATLTFTALYNVNNLTLDDEVVKSYFILGKKVEIALGYCETETVFAGYIYETNFSLDQETGWVITINCKDLLGILENKQDDTHRTGSNRIAEIRKILEDGSYSTYGKLAASQNTYLSQLETTYSTLDQAGKIEQTHTIMTHLDKIRWVAGKHNYDFFVVNKEVYFRPSYLESVGPIMTLAPNKGIISASMTQCIGKLISCAEVRGQDEDDFTAIIGKKTRSIKADLTKNKAATATVLSYDEEIRKVAEAKTAVEQMLDKNSWEVQSAKIETIGIPDIVPGRTIKLEGLGKTLEKSVYIRSVTHEFNEGVGYRTCFEGGIKIDG